MTMDARVTLLRRSDVTPEEFDKIAEHLKSNQLSINLKRGDALYHLGTLIAAYVGRDELMGDVSFNPGIRLITKGTGDEIQPLYVEWRSQNPGLDHIPEPEPEELETVVETPEEPTPEEPKTVEIPEESEPEKDVAIPETDETTEEPEDSETDEPSEDPEETG